MVKAHVGNFDAIADDGEVVVAFRDGAAIGSGAVKQHGAHALRVGDMFENDGDDFRLRSMKMHWQPCFFLDFKIHCSHIILCNV